MDLRSRLARLDPAARAPDADQDASPVGDAGRLGFERAEGAAGPVWIRETDTRRPSAPAHVTLLNRAAPRPAPDDLDPAEILFLDTETTGLAGGTGTLPFLVGLGWWADDRFKVRQYFLPSPGGERAMIAELAALAGRFRAVTTFNGQTFDLPLLRTRGILARRRDLLGELASWDLLPVSRRLWGRRLSDCRQQTVEAEVAGMSRGAGDIEGALIPAAYFAFVRDGRLGALRAVVEHNRRDMVGMAKILREAVARCGLMRTPGSAPPLPWADAWSLARLCESVGFAGDEIAWMDRAAADAPLAAAPPRFFVDAVRMLKRGGDWPRVAALLAAAESTHGRTPWSHLETAILCEHRLPDLPRALRRARALGDAHRIARLEAKIVA